MPQKLRIPCRSISCHTDSKARTPKNRSANRGAPAVGCEIASGKANWGSISPGRDGLKRKKGPRNHVVSYRDQCTCPLGNLKLFRKGWLFYRAIKTLLFAS